MYLIAQWSPKGWKPVAYVSTDKGFYEAWVKIQDGEHTYRGFQKAIDDRAPELTRNVIWHLGDDGILREAESWSMLTLERQAELTVDYPVGR